MDVSALKIAIDFSLSLITAYAVYAVIVGGFGRFFDIRTTWMEHVEAIGGALFLAGSLLWDREQVGVALALMLTGVSSFAIPRLVLIAQRGRKYD